MHETAGKLLPQGKVSGFRSCEIRLQDAPHHPPAFLAAYSESNNTRHAEHGLEVEECSRRSWHFLNGVAGAIFKVVGDVCAAKNLRVADEHVTSQRKGLRNKQGSLYCAIRWMYFGNVAGCDRGRNINTKLAASFL